MSRQSPEARVVYIERRIADRERTMHRHSERRDAWTVKGIA